MQVMAEGQDAYYQWQEHKPLEPQDARVQLAAAAELDAELGRALQMPQVRGMWRRGSGGVRRLFHSGEQGAGSGAATECLHDHGGCLRTV